jgi:hypothetical protein
MKKKKKLSHRIINDKIRKRSRKRRRKRRREKKRVFFRAKNK